MTAEYRGKGVELPVGHTGSSYFHDVLSRAVARFPEALATASLCADAGPFKERFPSALTQFEAARVQSPQRSEIARYICLEAERDLRFVTAEGETQLAQLMAEEAAPLPLVRVELSGPGTLKPMVSFEGKLYTGDALGDLVGDLRERKYMTEPAARGLERMRERVKAQGGLLSLRGERFVLLGAAAELAPTDMLLEAGAEVLWVDVREPPIERMLEPRLGGVLHYVEGGADLLSAPHRIAATIAEFARSGPVHVWMYAYAGGASQEWRLTASMNAITRRLPRALVKSVAMLISPTTPCAVSPEDAATADERKQRSPGWKRALYHAGRLTDGQLDSGDGRVSCSIVQAQGVSYQAAQYIGKMLSAEAYAVFGNVLEADTSAPLTVSANVAPITATRSLSHAVFEAAFLGAPLFDIWISKPSTTRSLSGLLAIHDAIDADAPASAAHVHTSDDARARAVFSQQIHGGVYAQPYALDGCITVAALKGLAQKPKLALGLFR